MDDGIGKFLDADGRASMTGELWDIFVGAGCKPECHICSEDIEVGRHFRLKPFATVTKEEHEVEVAVMVCATCDRKGEQAGSPGCRASGSAGSRRGVPSHDAASCGQAPASPNRGLLPREGSRGQQDRHIGRRGVDMAGDIDDRIEEEMRGGGGIDMERVPVTMEVLREALAGDYSVELVVRVSRDRVVRYPVVLEHLHLGHPMGFHAGIASSQPLRVEVVERKEG